MQIALVLEWFDPAGGGAERSTLQIASHLAQRGHLVTIFAGGAAARPPQGIELATWRGGRSGLGGGARVLFSRWAQDQIAQDRFDVSVSMTTAVPADVVQPRAGLVSEALERSAARRRGVLARLVKRASIALSPRYRRLLALERQTMRNPRIKRFIAISRYMTQQMQRHYAIAPDRIVLVPNAAQMPVLDPARRQEIRRRLRAGWAVADDTTLFLFAAMDPKRKGLDPLLRSLARLRGSGVDARLVVAGPIDRPWPSLARRYGVGEAVFFIGAVTEMAEVYAAADVTALPTWYDPASKVVLESMMLAVPAITTRYNGAADFVEEGPVRRGRIVAEPADLAGWAAAMHELCDPAERQRCAAACEGMADRLSMARHVELLEQILLDVRR